MFLKMLKSVGNLGERSHKLKSMFFKILILTLEVKVKPIAIELGLLGELKLS